jgi:DNA (cytosine-5)-methyltransferase 1
VFIVGCLTRGCAQQVLFERESSPWDSPPSREAGEEIAKDVAATIRSGSGQRGFPLEWEAGLVVSSFSAGNSGDSYGVAYSENVTPPLRAGNSGTNQTPTICFGGNFSGPVSVATTCSANGQRLDIESETFVTGPLANASGRRGWHVSAEDAASGKNLTTCSGVRRLTPREAERLQGFPDNWTAGQSDSARYRQLGNAVAVPVARWLGRRIVDL